MTVDFDLRAFRLALDTRRAALGLSWAAVAAELGVSVATLRGLGGGPVAEGDGVLRVVAWLGRSPESFVPGREATTEGQLPTELVGTLRFDTLALSAALEATRAARGLTWREVAVESGVGSAAALTRLRAGGRVMFPGVMRVLAWVGAPAARFVRAVER
jgi:transcriptional regulator with XRE-family HTH domain